MKEPIGELMRMGTIGSIFLSVLLIALVAFAGWARQLINNQLKQKDERINKLEQDMKELQQFIHTELIELIRDTQKLLQKSNDSNERTQERIEVLIKQTNKN